MRLISARCLFALMSIVPAGHSFAQSGADFFAVKTLTYVVATSPGGSYDTYGRLLADYMQRYLPESTFIVRNMHGAAHLVGTNAISASRNDGLTIGAFNTSLIHHQLMDSPGFKLDPTKMSWTGKVVSDPRVVIVT